jgi:hypothetical protein
MHFQCVRRTIAASLCIFLLSATGAASASDYPSKRECQFFCVRGLGDFSMAPLAAPCAGQERAARW